MNLSLAYTKLEKWETAVVHADQAIELRWRCIKAWYRKAYAQMQLGIGAPLPEAGPSMIERAWESVRVRESITAAVLVPPWRVLCCSMPVYGRPA